MALDGLKDAGHNALRDILTGVDSVADDIAGLRSTTPLPHFPIAVVEEVYYDPEGQIDQDEVDKLKTFLTPELAERVPRNTILARVISRGVDKSDNTPKLFFPANPYDAQPVKPGEQVFIFYSDPYLSQQIGFWWCRVPEPVDTDDMNFTHADRKYEYNADLSSVDRFNNNEIAAPGFPNGGGTEESQTTAIEGDYERIEEESLANDVITKEPVARFVKRPSDRVIQGSNGTRVVLGQERTGPASDTPDEFSPAIDIVATSYKMPSDNIDPEGSAPLVTTNTRGQREVDKNPKKSNKNNNLAEGDPDFEKDQTRIYISAKTNADKNFAIEIDGVVESGGGVSATVIKSDQIRLVARQNIKITTEEGGTAIVFDGKDVLIIPAADGVVRVGKADADQKQVRGDELRDYINNVVQEAIDHHAHLSPMGITSGPLPDPANPPTTGVSIPIGKPAEDSNFLSKKATVE